MPYGTVARRTVKRHTQNESSNVEDADIATNDQLIRDQKTWSKGRIRRMKVMSAIAGNTLPSRRKIFSTVQADSDYKLYSITVHNKTIPCAKVFNPALLERNSNTWNKLADVEKFELEDPEGTLTTIPKHYATNMEHLESLSITWTRVKSLPGELFRPGLKTLSLQRNHIKTLIGIDRAVDLTNLDVSSNLLTELPKTFGQLHNLIILNISGNAITELPANFGSLTQLKVVDCSCNRLGSIPESIRNLIELSSLDVSNNYLTTLPNGITELPKLEDLRAQANQLHYLPYGFGQLTKLSSLNLRKNKFTEVPLQLSSITTLHTLNMKDNIIRSFPSPVPFVKTLILHSNQLEEITDGLLGCLNVQTVSLENNKISSIPNEIKNLKSLRVLHLSRNNIDSVPEDIGGLTQLRHLSLSKTEIQTLPKSLLTMKELVKLDISDCRNLQNYLRLAYKDGGLSKLREELFLLYQNPQETTNDHDDNLTASYNSDVSNNSNTEEVLAVISKSSRATIFITDSETVDCNFTEEQDTGTLENQNTEQLPSTTQTESKGSDTIIQSTTKSDAIPDVILKKKEKPPTQPKTFKTTENSKFFNKMPQDTLTTDKCHGSTQF